MLSPPTCPTAETTPGAGLQTRIARQRLEISELEAALWTRGLDEAWLAPYQAAFRRLEGLYEEACEDHRHDFVIVIPVADNPRQTRACLDSLLALCRAFAYGGMAGGRYRKLWVLLADDSADATAIAAHRSLASEFDAHGLSVEYFGRDEQLALLARLPAALDLDAIVGVHDHTTFAHKGQAMMRNIAYLHLAAMPCDPARTLFFTVDGDQLFKVKVATPQGGAEVYALNFLFWLDEIFRNSDAQVLTGKVVGDPPVSPSVMAGNFLDDVLALLREMVSGEAGKAYRQPALETRGSGDAAYHDMADLFGFLPADAPYRYRCELPGTPSNAACLLAFSRRLHSFFHGEHPTRVTWYQPAAALASLAPARTVYTGNYVFRPSALRWFIPFAPLRLRMSGPSMGRILRAELGARFVSANLPMLHRRTMLETGAAEFRPGVRAEALRVDLCDEFERQFHGDVMLFTLQRLCERGFPRETPAPAVIAATLDAVRAEMDEKYQLRQQALREKLRGLRGLLADIARCWREHGEHAEVRDNLLAFAANLEHHFGVASPCLARLTAAERRADWRSRQLAAIACYGRDRAAWEQALAALRA